MRPFTLFVLLNVACAAASPATAAVITNLSDTPQTVSFPYWKQQSAATIAPGETLRIPGRMTVRYQGDEVLIDDNQEYAIWKDGTFSSQRRSRQNSAFRY